MEGYNRDDCVSTLRLRDWLEEQRADLVSSGVAVPRPPLAGGEPPEQVDERAERVEALRARLLDGIPEELRDRTEEQQARWLLAYLLDFHRREDKAVWWEYFRLLELPEEDLLDEGQALAGLAYVRREEVVVNVKTGRPTGSVVDRYRFPAQEMEIRRRGRAELMDGEKWGEVIRVDRSVLTVDVKKGKKQVDHHAASAFAFTYVNPRVMEEAIGRFAAGVVEGDRIVADGAPDECRRPSPAAGGHAKASLGRLRAAARRIHRRVRGAHRHRPRRHGPADPGPARGPGRRTAAPR